MVLSADLTSTLWDILRMSHFLKCRPISDLRYFCCAMLLEEAISPFDCNLGQAEIHRDR